MNLELKTEFIKKIKKAREEKPAKYPSPNNFFKEIEK